MSFQARLLLLLLGLSVLAIAINMVRTKRLRESYALLWVLVGIGLTISPFIADFLDRFAVRLGFEYPPALLLMLAVVGLLLLIFQLSLTLSRTEDRLKILTQELGLLRHSVAQLQSAVAERGNGATPAPQGPGNEEP